MDGRSGWGKMGTQVPARLHFWGLANALMDPTSRRHRWDVPGPPDYSLPGPTAQASALTPLEGDRRSSAAEIGPE
jgi:hypothetical protein